MKFVDIGGIGFGGRGTCIKCHRDLNDDEKRREMPICVECISELIENVKDNIDKNGIKQFSDDVDNLTDFILSSSKLMGLEDIVVMQVCFNIYMRKAGEIGKNNPFIAKKVFKDAKAFIDIELERLKCTEDGNLDRKENVHLMQDTFEELMNGLNNIMGDYNKNRKRDNIDDIHDDKKDNDSGHKDCGDNKKDNDGGHKKDDSGDNKKDNDGGHKKDDSGDNKKKRIKVD